MGISWDLTLGVWDSNPATDPVKTWRATGKCRATRCSFKWFGVSLPEGIFMFLSHTHTVYIYNYIYRHVCVCVFLVGGKAIELYQTLKMEIYQPHQAIKEEKHMFVQMA